MSSSTVSLGSIARKVDSLGVGEIFLNFIDRDRMMNGNDINCAKSEVESTLIPVIACSCIESIERTSKQ